MATETVEYEHPLNLLDDPHRYVEWQREVGADEAERLMNEAARRHMDKYGARAGLDIAERLDDALAQLEEFVV